MRGESSEKLELLKLLFNSICNNVARIFHFPFALYSFSLLLHCFLFSTIFAYFALCHLPFTLSSIKAHTHTYTHTQNLQHTYTYDYNQLLPYPAPTCTTCTSCHFTPSPSSLLILFYVFLLSTSSCAFVFAHFNECS